MQRQTSEDPSVCYACIGDEFLADEVKCRGVPGQCAYCGGEREVLALGEVARYIRVVFEKHFFSYTPWMEYDGTPGEPPFVVYRWDRDPRPLSAIIQDMTGFDDPILGDILEALRSGQRQPEDVRREANDPPDSYLEQEPDSEVFIEDWNDFVRGVHCHAGSLSLDAVERLKGIFGDISVHKGHSGQGAIRHIAPDDESMPIWRARVARSYEEVETILNSPSDQIGTPPPEVAKNGRMNPEGVSVFYGATDPSTCLSEVRPPVGSYVVVGKFKLLRPVRLLDLDVLANIEVQGSYFDPSYSEQKGRAAFFQRLVSEVNRPVMPNDEESEYLKTQVIADYLANVVEPRLDGIVYRSAQTNGSGQSLVLFNHASGNKEYSLPSDTRVSAGVTYENRHSEKYWNRLEVTVSHSSYTSRRATLNPGPVFDSTITKLGRESELDDKTDSPDDFYLRLELGSVKVSIIKRVEHLEEHAINLKSP